MDKLHAGIELYLSGDPYAAIRTLKEYAEEGGVSAGTAYYHIGIAYSDLQKLTDACENLKKAVELEPDKSTYHYRLGVVYSRLMILDAAIAELEKSLELNGEHQRSRFILGTIYFKRGDMKKAEEVFTALVKSSPDFAAAYYHRSLALYHMGRTDDAAEDLLRALELNPGYYEARLRLAQFYSKEGRYSDAAGQYSRIYEDGVRDWVFMRDYVMCLYKAGQKQKAREAAAEALVLFPHNGEIQEMLRADGR